MSVNECVSILASIDEDVVLNAISPVKDVDGCSSLNEGRLVNLGEMKKRANDKGLDDDIHYYNMVNFPSTALATLCFIEISCLVLCVAS